MRVRCRESVAVESFVADVGYDNDFILQRDGTPVCGSGNCWVPVPGGRRGEKRNELSWAMGALGAIWMGQNRDVQVYGDTFLYVSAPTTLAVPLRADVGRVWLNDVDVTTPGSVTLTLRAGWNHLEWTSYHQHEGTAFEMDSPFAIFVGMHTSPDDTCQPAEQASSANGGRLFCGDTITGTISTTGVGAVNRYTVAARTGESLILSIRSDAGASTSFSPRWRLIRPDQVEQTQCGGLCTSGILSQDGNYTVEVYESGNNATGPYVLAMQATSSTLNGAPSCAVPIASGEIRTGTLDGLADLDAFRFAGQAGERVLVRLITTAGPAVAYMRIYPPGGGSYIVGQTTSADFQLAQTGVYTVVVEDDQNTRTGTYELGLLKIPGPISTPDDPDGGAIASGQTRSGTFNGAADIDAFHFYGLQGDHVQVSIVRTSGTASPSIRLYPPGGGSSVASASSTLTHQLQLSGLYTVVVEDSTNTRTGTYNITLTKTPPDPRPGLYNPRPLDTGTAPITSCVLRWDAVTGATGYDVFFGSDALSPLSRVATNLTTPTLTCPPVDADVIYDWRVVAHTASGDIEGPYWWFRAIVPPDTTPPDTTIMSGPSGMIAAMDATFSWTGSDDRTTVGDLQYATRLHPIEPAFSALGSATARSYAALSSGSYVFHVKARDEAGNEDPTPATRAFTVNQAPDGPIATPVTNVTVTAGQSVTFQGSATDPDGNTPLSYRWTFGGSGIPDATVVSPGARTVSTPGVYTVAFTVTDALGMADPTPATRTITVLANQPPNGTITAPAADVTIAAGQSVAFEGTGADPDGHVPLTYRWTFGGSGIADSTARDAGPRTFTTPGSYVVTFTATDALGLSTLVPPTRSVTVRPSARLTVTLEGRGPGTIRSDPHGIDCGADCTELYERGTRLVLTATHAGGSLFTGWRGCEPLSETTCGIDLDRDRRVKATFVKAVTVTITTTGSGSGTVTIEPERITCGPGCTRVVPLGAAVRLVAAADDGSRFVRWNGCPHAVGRTCDLTLRDSRQVTAVFSPPSVMLGVGKAGSGSGTVTSDPAGIQCGRDCVQPYVVRTAVQLTAVPAAGSRFVGWSGCDTVDADRCSVLMTRARRVSATFAPGPGPSVVSVAGRRLVVRKRNPDGTLGPPNAYVIRGVNWSPASRGTATSPSDPGNADARRPEFGTWFGRDIPLMSAMNVTTVRTLIHLGTADADAAIGHAVLDELYAHGIMVTMTVDDGIGDLARVGAIVDRYRAHPAILMWSIGSEWNVNRFFGAVTTVRDAALRTEAAAQLVKARDPDHPVVASYGEIDIDADGLRLADTARYVNDLTPSVDVWSLNVYRANRFGSLFSQWRTISTKPMFIGEFGTDAFRTTTFPPLTCPAGGVVDETMKASWTRSLWDDIARNLAAPDQDRVALGGLYVSWNDEWWKVPPSGSQETCGHDRTPGGHPDVVANEEYLGMVDYLGGVPDGAVVMVAVADEAGLDEFDSCTVLGAARRRAVLPPRLDVEHPGRLLHRARGRRARGAQHVADVLVDLLALPPPVAGARDGAAGVVGDLAGQVDQPAAVDDDALVEVAGMVLGVELLEQRLARRRHAEVDDQLDLDQHRAIGEPSDDEPGRGRSRDAEELRALGAAGRVVGVDVGDVDELLHDVREAGARAREDRLQPLERAVRLRRHAAGDERAVGVASGEPGGEQHARRVDADRGHEAASLLDGTVGEDLAAIHRVLLTGPGSSCPRRAPCTRSPR